MLVGYKEICISCYVLERCKIKRVKIYDWTADFYANFYEISQKLRSKTSGKDCVSYEALHKSI